MAYDDPKLPRSILRGEHLFVGDDKVPYFRDPKAWVFLNVTDLSIRGGFEPNGRSLFDDSGPGQPLPIQETLAGRAALEKDHFALAGMNFGGKDQPIDFTLWPASSELETEFLWRGAINYAHLWEYGREAMFLAGANMPLDQFDALLAAVRTGRIQRIRVVLRTTMWTRDKGSAFDDIPRTWHLVPPTDSESSKPSSEVGTIVSIKWDELCGPRTPPVETDSPPPKPTNVELSAKLYSPLSIITAVLLAMLALQIFRH
jgi:hypothetical protein